MKLITRAQAQKLVYKEYLTKKAWLQRRIMHRIKRAIMSGCCYTTYTFRNVQPELRREVNNLFFTLGFDIDMFNVKISEDGRKHTYTYSWIKGY